MDYKESVVSYVHRKQHHVLTYLLLTVLFASGCFGGKTIQHNTGIGRLSLRIQVPTQYVKAQSDLVDQIELDTLELTLTKGDQLYTEVLSIDSEDILVDIPELNVGIWQIVVTARDIDGYIAFTGNQQASIVSDALTTVKVGLHLYPGDLQIMVEIPDTVDASYGEITLIDLYSVASKTVPLAIAGTIGSAAFSQISPGLWPVRVKLFDSEDRVIAQGEGPLQVLPGRESTAWIIFEETPGTLKIIVSWNLPPLAPDQLIAYQDGNSIIFEWAPNTETDIKGYVVYRRESGSEKIRLVSESLQTTTSYKDQRIEAGKTYWYWVQAYAVTGLGSPLSAPVEVVVTSGVSSIVIDVDY